jgi:lysozyme family protein
MAEGDRVMDFDTAFDRLIGSEGRFSIRRSDPGNWTGGKVGVGELKGTKYGISAATYPKLDIRNLTLGDARAIYRADFWRNDFPPALAFQLFDAAVNHGAGNAAKILQRALGVEADGKIGPVTRAAVAAADPFVLGVLFGAERLDFWTRCGDWAGSGKGWTRRGAKNLRLLVQDARA